MNNLIGVIFSTIYILFILWISKFLEVKGEEISRKFVHIALCNIWFIYLTFIDSVIWASILPAVFVVINILSYKFKIIKSMEREKNDGFGTVYYAISILFIAIFSYLIKNPLIGASGIFIMGYGDGFAAILGQMVESKTYMIGKTKKSFAGSFTMFCISLFILLVVLDMLGVNYFIVKAVGISLVATVLEAISIKGFDNITVPVIVTVATYLCL